MEVGIETGTGIGTGPVGSLLMLVAGVDGVVIAIAMG